MAVITDNLLLVPNELLVTNQRKVTNALLVGGTPTQATPTFDPPAGEYFGTQSVTITSAGADHIYYTTDGSTPTPSSTEYTGPISVAASETVKAIATKAGFNTSAVGSAAYTIDGPSPPLFVQQKQSITSGATPAAVVTFDAPVTLGNSIFVFVTQASFHIMGSASPTDDAGNVYELIHGPDIVTGTLGGGTVNTYVYACFNSIGTPSTITCTGLSNTNTAIPMIVAVETTIAAVDDAQSNSPTFNTGSPVVGPSLTTTADTDLLLNFAFTADGAGSHVYSAGSGWAVVAQLGDTGFLGERVSLQDQTAGAAGSYASTINVAANSGAGIMTSLALKGGIPSFGSGLTYQQSNSTPLGNSSAPSLAFAAPVTTGNTVLVQFNMFDGVNHTVTSVTDDAGNTYTSVLGPNTSPTDGFGNGATRQVFMCGNVTGTPQTISGVANGITGLMIIVEINGASTVDATQYASTANATAQDGGAITTGFDDEFLVAFMGYMNGSGTRTYVPGVNWVGVRALKETAQIGEQVILMTQQSGAAGSYTVTSTLDVAPGGGGGSQCLALKLAVN